MGDRKGVFSVLFAISFIGLFFYLGLSNDAFGDSGWNFPQQVERNQNSIKFIDANSSFRRCMAPCSKTSRTFICSSAWLSSPGVSATSRFANRGAPQTETDRKAEPDVRAFLP